MSRFARRSVKSLALAALALVSAPALADVKPAAVFSDHAVLQRDVPLVVWGRAAPGEKVTVTLAGASRAAVANETGRWQVTLDPLPAGGPYDLVTAGANTVTSRDILVGDVWLCSGQSNMEFTVKRALNASAETAGAQFPSIRMFTVKRVVADEPREEAGGSWEVCSPRTVGEFSAVAYFFGREIHQVEKVPVGLVHASCGWTPSESWTPRDALLAHPETAYIARRWDAIAAVTPAQRAEYTLAMQAWAKDADRAKREAREPPARPKNPGDPNFIHRASGLWNGCIAPLTPLSLRGVIWYQGETNERRGYRYRIEFPLLIESWRKAFGRPDLPFLFVQVANVLPPDPEPVESEWAELRESQTLALALPHTGMAVTIDIGEEKDVHPKNKQETGRRLALVARALVYGEKVCYAGPMLKGIKAEGNRIRVSFDHVEGGLKTPGGAPLRGFAIAGPDRKFVYADARIEGDSVVVWSDRVALPVAVRYAWANNPAGCNLYNSADLPACPFRSDDWPAKTQNAKGLVIDDMWK